MPKLKPYKSLKEARDVSARKIYVGTNTPISSEEGIYEAYLLPNQQHEGWFSVIIFKGYSTKPYAFYRYDNVKKAGEAIDKFIDQIKKMKADSDAFKNKKKAQAKTTFDNIKIGDIFYTSWGYEQTNVEFYQIIEKKANTVIAREIGREAVPSKGNSDMSGMFKPIKDKFVGAPFVARVTAYGLTGGEIVDSASPAFPYTYGDNGVYVSWYG